MRKKITRIIAMASCAIMISTTALIASPMKDVSSNHWAYKEITEMQRRGLLVPSSQGEFFPNNYVTYFEFSQILAKATGYQDASTNSNIAPALKKAIADNFAKQKSTIEAHQKNYKHWQKDANKEIAYLIGKGYLKKEDLGKFMSKSTSGMESKRGVRKQEAAVYLVRILHLEETAKQEYTTTGFKDEASIDVAARPHVAYLKKKGIISGDVDSTFGPGEPINRAILSIMLVNTLDAKNTPQTPLQPTPPTVDKPVTPPTTPAPQKPIEKDLEGQLTKMISKGDNGYYVVLEVEPTKIHTYTIEPTATVVDRNGTAISLPALKERIDAKDRQNVNVTVQVYLIGTTEYMTYVKLTDYTVGTERPNKPERPKEDWDRDQDYKKDRDQDYKRDRDQGYKNDRDQDYKNDRDDNIVSEVLGSIYSILHAPTPEITIQLNDGTRKVYKAVSTSELYSELTRKEISLWDLRLNQQIEMALRGREIQKLDVVRAAAPATLTGTITKASINGNQIDLRVSYDAATQESNVVRTVNVPMVTQITDGTIQRGRKDLRPNMQVIVVFGESGNLEPEKIVILGN